MKNCCKLVLLFSPGVFGNELPELSYLVSFDILWGCNYLGKFGGTALSQQKVMRMEPARDIVKA